MRSEAREAAYVEFVTARQGQLRRIAYAVCGDWQQADELLHTALTRLYVAWPRLEREGAEEAFVRRIIVRSNVDPGRRAAPDSQHAEPDRTPLFEALQALPALQRKTAVLRHWLGLSVEETAEELGISTGAVQTHSARALTSLQGALTPEQR
jgi:DNA-directed RNA polymerase specialized sigma24 family protein